MNRSLSQACVSAALALVGSVVTVAGQQRQVPNPQAPNPQQQVPRQVGGAATSGRAGAVFDVTGYWVSVINEDWRWRMLTPPKGDNSGVPTTIEARRVADMWDPAKDEAEGLQCKAYGAPGVMRLPTRLHITWQDDQTLKIDFDTGTQTRLIHFGSAQPAKSESSWQGYSVGVWEGVPGDTAGRGRRGATAPTGPRDLKVFTTGLRAGYLRKNGLPYSEHATLTEYFDLFPKQPNGDEWLVVNQVVHDPLYLTEAFITSDNFKREADGSKWNPTPCAAR